LPEQPTKAAEGTLPAIDHRFHLDISIEDADEILTSPLRDSR
jgi:hypothetical protein